MANIFQNVSSKRLPRNNFNMSREVLLSGQLGKLIPIQCDEVVEGDKFKQNVNFLVRFAPLSAPAMVRFNVHFHSFFVPYRIITPRSSELSTWEKFVEQVGNASTGENIPELPSMYTDDVIFSEEQGDIFPSASNFGVGSLWDYFGLPIISSEIAASEGINIPFERRISLLPFLAYQKIFNDWFRRDQIEEELKFPVDLGAVNFGMLDELADMYTNEDVLSSDVFKFFMSELFKLRERNYERDYFTSALPEPQFGDDVLLGGGVVSSEGAKIMLSSIEDLAFKGTPLDVTNMDGAPAYWINSVDENLQRFLQLGSDGGPGFANTYATPWKTDEITANVNSISGFLAPEFSINELRLAMQLQGIREKINRGGTRYIEILKSVFGVTSSDARLQRVQYLGGFKAPVTVGTVVQQSATDADGKLGELAGKAQAGGFNHLFTTKRIFEEKGFVITLMSITPRTSYYGGVPRKFRKFDPIDYYTPDFDHLGEQEVKPWELYDSIDGRYTTDEQLIPDWDKTFGYSPRYSEYKSALSSVHGEFRTTLDNWHVSRSFNGAPTLSPSFIHADKEDFDRLFIFENVENTSNEHFYAQIVLDVVVKRNASKFSTPFTFY